MEPNDELLQSLTASVPPLYQVLLRCGARLPECAAQEIIQDGPAAIEPLIRILTNYDLWEEQDSFDDVPPSHAAILLGRLGVREAVQPMLSVLQNTDRTRMVHDRILKSLPLLCRHVVEPCLELLRDDIAPELRGDLCDILSGCGVRDERIYCCLVEYLESEDDIGLAASALAQYGDPRAIELLVPYVGPNRRELAQRDTREVLEALAAIRFNR